MATLNFLGNNLSKRQLFYKMLIIAFAVLFFVLSKYEGRQMVLDARNGLFKQAEQKELLSWVFQGLCYLSIVFLSKKLWPVIAFVFISHLILYMFFVKF